MIYVMSDIHGEYDKYIKMLELINFSNADELYVLGDIVDRGKEPVKVLLDMIKSSGEEWKLYEPGPGKVLSGLWAKCGLEIGELSCSEINTAEALNNL